MYSEQLGVPRPGSDCGLVRLMPITTKAAFAGRSSRLISCTLPMRGVSSGIRRVAAWEPAQPVANEM